MGAAILGASASQAVRRAFTGRRGAAGAVASPTLWPMAADTISFARGAPSLDIVDVEGLKAAAKRAFENAPAGLTGYGTAIGYPPLRQWIADQHQVEAANVIVTNGSMEAEEFLVDHLVAPRAP